MVELAAWSAPGVTDVEDYLAIDSDPARLGEGASPCGRPDIRVAAFLSVSLRISAGACGP